MLCKAHHNQAYSTITYSIQTYMNTIMYHGSFMTNYTYIMVDNGRPSNKQYNSLQSQCTK